MLNEADPTAPESGDPPELAGAEEGVINSMAPLIDTGKKQWHPMPGYHQYLIIGSQTYFSRVGARTQSNHHGLYRSGGAYFWSALGATCVSQERVTVEITLWKLYLGEIRSSHDLPRRLPHSVE